MFVGIIKVFILWLLATENDQ